MALLGSNKHRASHDDAWKRFSQDGSAYAFSYVRELSGLYLVSGLP